MTEAGRYGATAKWLHWLIAVLVIIMLVAGRTLESLPLTEREQMIMVHSGLGTLVLLLMLVRLRWRLSHAPPDLPDSMGSTQIRLSKFVHRALYVLLIVQPLLGFGQALFIADYQVVAFGLIDYSSMATADEGLAQIFHIAHGLNSLILSALVLGHIGAAFYHHFRQQDGLLRRMWPGS